MDSKLMQALVAIQEGHGWTDARMAAELGVSQPMWSLVRSHKRRPGGKLLGGVERRFPDLRPLVSLFLRGDMPIVNTPSQTAAG